MAKLIIRSYPADRSSSGSIQVHIMLADPNASPLPSRTVEIKRAADAQTAFEAYCADLAATGKKSVASMSIAKGDRSPPGFKALAGAKGSVFGALLARQPTWREALANFFATREGPVELDELYRHFRHHPSPNARAKIRERLQTGPYRRVARGVWARQEVRQ